MCQKLWVYIRERAPTSGQSGHAPILNIRLYRASNANDVHTLSPELMPIQAVVV